MGQFGAQDDLTADLPNVLQNMLHEFAERDESPLILLLAKDERERYVIKRILAAILLILPPG